MICKNEYKGRFHPRESDLPGAPEHKSNMQYTFKYLYTEDSDSIKSAIVGRKVTDHDLLCERDATSMVFKSSMT